MGDSYFFKRPLAAHMSFTMSLKVSLGDACGIPFVFNNFSILFYISFIVYESLKYKLNIVFNKFFNFMNLLECKYKSIKPVN